MALAAAFSSCCLSIMSMFSFQAIHNQGCSRLQGPPVVYRLCQCSLFKQFTTCVHHRWLLLRCLSIMSMFSFQAIHNLDETINIVFRLFIDYVNVLFSSNSQPHRTLLAACSCCLSIMSMFSFQAIHNVFVPVCASEAVVYRLCQCSLFKQFTTKLHGIFHRDELFIDYVNVLFSSNSQPISSTIIPLAVVYRLCQCSLFKQFTTAAICMIYSTELFIDYVNVLFSSNWEGSE